MNNEPVAYGMLTFCKNCGEQNPYAVKELTDEEIYALAVENGAWISEKSGDVFPDDLELLDFARAILRKAQEK